MSGQFDKVARALASDMPRRKVLRMVAGGITASFSATVLGKNAVAQAEGNPPTTLLFVNTTQPECNYTTNYCPPINQGPPDKVVTIKVPFINQAGVPYLPGVIEEVLPDIPGISWIIVPVPVPPVAVPYPTSPGVNQTTPEPPQNVVIEVPPMNHGIDPDIRRIIEDRLSRVPSINWDVVQFPRNNRGR